MTPRMPLTMAPVGKECCVVGITAGRGLARRLMDMGFNENVPVRIVRSDRGAVIVDVNGCKFGIGRGMAMKIMVEECESEKT